MFVVLMYVSFSVTTGRRVCADAARPLRWVPPIERGRAVALYRYGCRRRGPPAPGPACRQRGGFLIGGTVPFYPPAPARPISALACLVSWRYRSAFPSAVPHPFSCFRSGSVGGSVTPGEPSAGLSAGLSPPWSRRRSVRSCPSVVPRPVSASACLAFRRYRRSFSVRPAPPYQCFRSVGFRRPREAVEDSDRRAKQVRTPPGITISGRCACVSVIPVRRAYTSDRSIDAMSLVLRRAHAPALPGG